MNITDIKKEECCGCTACKFICPVSAILMQEDSQGFLYPVVDETKCIQCGICLDICKNKNASHIHAPMKAYAAKSKDINVQKKSSSGGIAAELAMDCIRSGGIVYGVVYDDSYNVITARIDNLRDCDKLYGSKYVQTNLKNTLSEVVSDLESGKKVLYFGTSCHITGLLEILDRKQINKTNLITVDIICHGVPSPRLFNEYIKFLKKDTDFAGFSFRTKRLKWGNGGKQFGASIFHRNGRIETNTLRSNAFLRIFFSNNCLRPACYHCNHIGLNKVGDFTIADYWGLKNVHPEFFDEYGVSAVFANSAKAEKILNGLKNISYIESSVESISKKQQNMQQYSTKGENYNNFWQEYYNSGFDYILRKYAELGFLAKLKRRIKKILGIEA